MFYASMTKLSPLCLLLICMVVLLGASVSSTAQTPLYQLHKDGKIWRYTGPPCNGSSCPGWQMLDNNLATKAIVADGTLLYQLHNNGKIFRFTGTPCSGNNCPGWRMLDNNTATKSIVAANGQLFQLHTSGKIWQFTGTPCNGDNCPGWQMLDNNAMTLAIVADTVPLISNPSAHANLTVGTIGSGTLLYQLHKNGRIFRYTGTPCSGVFCPGWQMLDNNPATKSIIAGAGRLYQMHDTGKIWRYTNIPCNGDSCPGWQMLHNDSRNVLIAAGGDRLYRVNSAPSFQHSVNTIWIFTGTPCTGNICPGWQMLSRNVLRSTIAANRVDLYQLFLSGPIFKFNGTPCSGNSCPGWQMLDNNPSTRAIESH